MKKINKNLFKKVLSKFATGITVIAINSKNKNIGKTVNSFSAVSLTPPLVLFSLDKKSSSIEKFKKSKFLSINILSKNQKDLSLIFSKKNSKWSKIKFTNGKFSTPLIINCIANLECKNIKLLNQGDHIIFICKVLEVTFKNKLKPLLYYDSKYQ